MIAKYTVKHSEGWRYRRQYRNLKKRKRKSESNKGKKEIFR